MVKSRIIVTPRAPGAPPPAIGSRTGHIWGVGGPPGAVGVPEPEKWPIFRWLAQKNVKNLKLADFKGESKKSVCTARPG